MMCRAESKVTGAKPSSYFICTLNRGHRGRHSACDGRGHVLARWRSDSSKVEIFGPFGPVMV